MRGTTMFKIVLMPDVTGMYGSIRYMLLKSGGAISRQREGVERSASQPERLSRLRDNLGETIPVPMQ